MKPPGRPGSPGFSEPQPDTKEEPDKESYTTINVVGSGVTATVADNAKIKLDTCDKEPYNEEEFVDSVFIYELLLSLAGTEREEALTIINTTLSKVQDLIEKDRRFEYCNGLDLSEEEDQN